MFLGWGMALWLFFMGFVFLWLTMLILLLYAVACCCMLILFPFSACIAHVWPFSTDLSVSGASLNGRLLIPWFGVILILLAKASMQCCLSFSHVFAMRHCG